jgi:hypothetical protein
LSSPWQAPIRRMVRRAAVLRLAASIDGSPKRKGQIGGRSDRSAVVP